MNEITNVADIVEANGRTIRENNLARQHAIPLGTLVYVKYHSSRGDASWKTEAKLYVFEHTRDCDGTPLYTLATFSKQHWTPHDSLNLAARALFDKFHGVMMRGMSEQSLTVVDDTSLLQWPETN